MGEVLSTNKKITSSPLGCGLHFPADRIFYYFRIMQSWITGIIVILTFVIKQPLAAQSGKELKAFKKEERRDVDSLFLVHSLPIFISHSDNFTQLTIEDSLMAVLKEKKYKLIDNSTYEQMFKSRFLEVMPNPASVTFKEDLKRLQTDKNY